MSPYVYILYHVHPEDEDWKLIGVYSDDGKAMSAVSEVKTRLGFVDHPDAFQIVRHETDETGWRGGYVRS